MLCATRERCEPIIIRKPGTPGRIRTCGLWVRNPTLYPLSYRRMRGFYPRPDRDGSSIRRCDTGGKGGIRTLERA